MFKNKRLLTDEEFDELLKLDSKSKKDKFYKKIENQLYEQTSNRLSTRSFSKKD